MPIFASTNQKLDTIEIITGGKYGKETYNHQTQIRMEESKVDCFTTNTGFCFAGQATIFVPCLLRNLQLVVLVLCTHSIGGESRISTSMETWRIFSLLGTEQPILERQERTAQILSVTLKERTVFWHPKLGTMKVLGSQIPVHFVHSVSQEWFYTTTSSVGCWRSHDFHIK